MSEKNEGDSGQKVAWERPDKGLAYCNLKPQDKAVLEIPSFESQSWPKELKTI